MIWLAKDLNDFIRVISEEGTGVTMDGRRKLRKQSEERRKDNDAVMPCGARRGRKPLLEDFRANWYHDRRELCFPFISEFSNLYWMNDLSNKLSIYIRFCVTELLHTCSWLLTEPTKLYYLVCWYGKVNAANYKLTSFISINFQRSQEIECYFMLQLSQDLQNS